MPQSVLIDITSLENVAHVIQVALTPIFMLSGVSSLLNVFSTRMGRVSDRIHVVSAALAATNAEKHYLSWQLGFLRKRLLLLDLATIMVSLAGVATCLAALALFFAALQPESSATVLFSTFAIAVICTVFAQIAFLAEAMMTSFGLRKRAERINNDKMDV